MSFVTRIHLAIEYSERGLSLSRIPFDSEREAKKDFKRSLKNNPDIKTVVLHVPGKRPQKLK